MLKRACRLNLYFCPCREKVFRCVCFHKGVRKNRFCGSRYFIWQYWYWFHMLPKQFSTDYFLVQHHTFGFHWNPRPLVGSTLHWASFSSPAPHQISCGRSSLIGYVVVVVNSVLTRGRYQNWIPSWYWYWCVELPVLYKNMDVGSLYLTYHCLLFYSVLVYKCSQSFDLWSDCGQTHIILCEA